MVIRWYTSCGSRLLDYFPIIAAVIIHAFNNACFHHLQYVFLCDEEFSELFVNCQYSFRYKNLDPGLCSQPEPYIMISLFR